MVRDSLWLQPAEHHIMSLRYKRPSGFGVAGGGDGTHGRDLALGASRRTASTGSRRPVPDVLPRRRSRSRACSIPTTNEPEPRRRVPVLRTASPRGTPRRWPGFATSRTAAAASAIRSSASPERVKRDVRDGYVTIEGAARDYGVVVTGDPEEDPENLAVDLEATERLRAGAEEPVTATAPIAPPEPGLTAGRAARPGRGAAAAPRRAPGRDGGTYVLRAGDARGVPEGGLLPHARAAALRRVRGRPPHLPAGHRGDRARLPVDRLVPVSRLGARAAGRSAVRGARAGRALRRRGLPLRGGGGSDRLGDARPTDGWEISGT